MKQAGQIAWLYSMANSWLAASELSGMSDWRGYGCDWQSGLQAVREFGSKRQVQLNFYCMFNRFEIGSVKYTKTGCETFF